PAAAAAAYAGAPGRHERAAAGDAVGERRTADEDLRAADVRVRTLRRDEPRRARPDVPAADDGPLVLHAARAVRKPGAGAGLLVRRAASDLRFSHCRRSGGVRRARHAHLSAGDAIAVRVDHGAELAGAV